MVERMDLPPPGSGDEDPDGGYWYDQFVAYASNRDNWESKTYAGWGLSVEWVKKQAKKYDADKVTIIVTDKRGRIIDPEEYRLWIRGYRSTESFMEDIPPTAYP